MKHRHHVLLLWLGFACLASAQTTAVLSPIPRVQYLDSSGRPLNGGRLYSYAAGTSSPANTYTDSTGSVANTNPIVLDAGGRAGVWILPTVPYKFTLRDRNGVLIWTVDNVTAGAGSSGGGGGGGGGSFLPLTGGTMSGSISFGGNQIYSIGDSTNRVGVLYTGSVNAYVGLFPGVSGGAAVGSNTRRFNKLWANGADIDGEFTLPQISGGTAQCLEASTAGIVSGTGAPCGGGGGGGGGAAGPNTAVQFKTSLGAFGGDASMVWDNGSKQLTITTAGATAGFVVNTGFVHADAGFVTSNSAINSIQAPIGGLSGKWLVATDSLFLIEETAPALSGLGQTRIYADSSTHNVQVSQNGGAYTTLGGGSGSPGGANTNVQFNASGAFGGSANFAWDNTTRQLNVTTVGATAGIKVNTGYMQADGGFLASGCTAANCIQAIVGGLSGKWLTATDSVFFLEEAAPALSAGGQARIYADSSTHTLQVSQDGGAYAALGGGSGSPGGANTNVQFNSVGAFGGSTNFTWDNSTRQLNVTTAGATAGIKVNTGFLQADGGLSAASCALINCIQAVSGGLTGKWLTATDSVFLVEEAAPALSAGGQVRIYADSGTHSIRVSQNGGAYAPLGGSGTPGGANTNIQFNSSGSFGGSANLVWDNSTQQLNVTTAGSTAGIKVTTGYLEAIGGFSASTCVAINCVQAPTGGLSGKFLTASDSLFLLEEAAPALSGAGQARIYADTATHTLQVSQNGGAYAAFGAGGAFVPLAGGTMSGLLTIGVSSGSAAALQNSGGTATLTVTNTSGGPTAVFSRDVTVNSATGGAVGLGPTVWLPATDNSVSLGDNTHRFNNIFGDVFLRSTLSMGGFTVLDSARNASFANLTISGTCSGCNTAPVFNATNSGSSITFQNSNTNFQVDGNGNVSAHGDFNMTGPSSTYKANGVVFVDASRNATFQSGVFLNGVNVAGGSFLVVGGSLFNGNVGIVSTLTMGSGATINGSATTNGKVVLAAGNVSGLSSVEVQGRSTGTTTNALIVREVANPFGSGITMMHGSTLDAAWQAGSGSSALHVVGSDGFTTRFLVYQNGHMQAGGNPPPSVSGSASCTLVGGANDVRGTANCTASGSATITFQTAYSSVPVCVSSSPSSGASVTLVTTSGISFATFAGGQQLNYHCIQ